MDQRLSGEGQRVALRDGQLPRVRWAGARTREQLVNARASDGLVTVFGRLFAKAYPLERMRLTSAAELNAPPTGDDNTTAVFGCRPVRGHKTWSQHACGLAVDLNPFQNPYHKGNVVLPELAASYLDRGNVRPRRDPFARARRAGVRHHRMDVGRHL
jgi:hypothetical protein